MLQESLIERGIFLETLLYELPELTSIKLKRFARRTDQKKLITS